MTENLAPVEVRCFCAAKVQLAQIEHDSAGRPRLRVKAVRRGSTIIDVIVVEGVVKIMCRECERYHRFTVRRSDVHMDMSLFTGVFPRTPK